MDNIEYWNKKIDRNILRDIEVNNYYKSNNEDLVRIWEHDLKNDFEGTINEIYLHIIKIKNGVSNSNQPLTNTSTSALKVSTV